MSGMLAAAKSFENARPEISLLPRWMVIHFECSITGNCSICYGSDALDHFRQQSPVCGGNGVYCREFTFRRSQEHLGENTSRRPDLKSIGLLYPLIYYFNCPDTTRLQSHPM